jgi:cell division protein FtsA
LNQIQKAISESGYEKRILAGVVLTGGGALLRHIKELCHYTLQRNTRIGIPDIGVVNSIPSELKNPMFATSLGLLKHGIQVSEQKDTECEEEYYGESRKRRTQNGERKTENGKRKTVNSERKTEIKKEKANPNSIWEIVKKWLDTLLDKTS